MREPRVMKELVVVRSSGCRRGIETVTSCKQNTLKVTKEPMNQTSCNKSHTKDQNNLTNQISYFGDYLILSESIQSYNQSLAQETRPNTSKNRSHKRIETIITSTTTKLEIDPYHAQGSGDTPLFLEDDERIEDEESKLKVNKTDDEDLVERGGHTQQPSAIQRLRLSRPAACRKKMSQATRTRCRSEQKRAATSVLPDLNPTCTQLSRTPPPKTQANLSDAGMRAKTKRNNAVAKETSATTTLVVAENRQTETGAARRLHSPQQRYE
ncbi:hypothetical protein YC2023_078524 [Brassica napus]